MRSIPQLRSEVNGLSQGDTPALTVKELRQIDPFRSQEDPSEEDVTTAWVGQLNII